MSTMLSFQNQNLGTFMSNEEVFAKCPYAKLTTPSNPAVSTRYVQANTQTIVEDLGKLNWFPVEAKQCRQKANSKGIRSFHMIAFQNPNVTIMDKGEVECYPRIILTNSHDGFNSFKFMVGLFRLVCSNGLILATNKMVELSIRHMNYDFEELRKIVAESITQIGEQTQIIQGMKEVEVNKSQMRELAIKAIKLRAITDIKPEDIEEESINQVLCPKRVEDEGNSLWNVYNRIQENITNGDYMMTNQLTKKTRKVRPIKSVVKDLSFNKGLFNAAYGYMPIAA